jgi:uncharacterized BrkB/YihY/UPF0761 family membrane protein
VLSALQVVDQLNRFLPDTLHDDIRRLVLGTRDDSPLLLVVAIAAMLWTTSGAIGVIERCLARITDGPRHHIVVGRLRNVALGGLVAVAVILASLSISVVSDFSYKLRADSGIPGPTIVVINTLGSILVFAAIYHLAPLGHIHWIPALKGAVPAGIAIQVVPAIVGIYVRAAAGLAPVQLFLLLAVVLLGLYIVAMAMLVGAGLAACLERERWP